jgi:hypothetical protein
VRGDAFAGISGEFRRHDVGVNIDGLSGHWGRFTSDLMFVIRGR